MKEKEFKPQAVLSITNSCSIEISLAEEDCDYYIYSRMSGGDIETLSPISRSRVKSTSKGNFFNRGGVRYYLSEFVKLHK